MFPLCTRMQNQQTLTGRRLFIEFYGLKVSTSPNPSVYLLKLMDSETTDEDRSIQVPPTPTHRKSGDPTQPPPNAHPSSSQPRQRLCTPTPALPVHRKLPPSAPHNTLTIPVRFDSPPPSPVPDTPPLSPAREGGRVKDLNIYIDLVGLESTPRGFAPSIHQDRAKGPQDRWYYVIKGRNVGVFNNW